MLRDREYTNASVNNRVSDLRDNGAQGMHAESRLPGRVSFVHSWPPFVDGPRPQRPCAPAGRFSGAWLLW
jgi:hypothetical protein